MRQLHVAVIRFLSKLGGDWNRWDTESRRPARDEAVAIVVKGIKEEGVMMTRGGCTFARKVLRTQAAGSAGVIIIQTVDVWPYTMTDSTGESKDVKISAFMMAPCMAKGMFEELHCNCYC
ncbi:hypothetical protein PsorP6_012300 [Peronosclerospora sorghi]|uniref:Uncharacterized protein n=1 Tax=Peronosclerospora sorghi TaxID=230839 RepID=A0ACC0WHT2_9STRA|nr:hypothetical protein PsorP6_012300 [Peronosclerospora sorghi]